MQKSGLFTTNAKPPDLREDGHLTPNRIGHRLELLLRQLGFLHQGEGARHRLEAALLRAVMHLDDVPLVAIRRRLHHHSNVSALNLEVT